MDRSKRSAWSYNEFFAHKKNVGEEVKLKDRLVSIERRHGITKDILKHDIGNVRTSLKNLRRSTGHSIDALPPTPFRVDTRRYSIMPLVKRESCSTLAASEDDCVGDNWNQNGLNEYLSVGTGAISPLSDDSLQYSIACTRENTQDSQNESSPCVYNMSDGKNRDKGNHRIPLRVESTSLDLNSITSLQRNKYFGTDGFHDKSNTSTVKDELKLPHINTTQNKDNYKVTNIVSSEQRVFDAVKSNEGKLIHQAVVEGIEIPERKQAVSFYRSSSQISENPESALTESKQIMSPLSREITTVLNEGELKRRVYVRQNSFVGMDGNTLAILQNKAQQDSTPRTANQRNEENAHIKQEPAPKKMKNPRNNFLRNTRTRCRTCMERFRQNVEFQRRKLELEKEAEKQAKLLLKRQASSKSLKSKERSMLLNLDDLDSVLSDEVLDFDNGDMGKMKKYNGRRPKKGYSRKRMEELSEPKKGMKRKMLFSKGLIKKEVDTLIENHAQPQLTVREKEKLRILESKIRMFLATMQRDLMPVSMVHLPQREDIMKVDISHL